MCLMLTHARRALLATLLALGPLLGAGAVQVAVAEVSSEARTPAEVYERKKNLLTCLSYVVRDLKARSEAAASQGPAELLLVIDPTTTLKDEIDLLRRGLKDAWLAGPVGLRIGVYGMGADEYQAPSRLPNDADSQLASLAFLPVDGPRSVLAGVRAAAERLDTKSDGPKALLLVTQDYDGGEDDVEKTRDAVLECGAAFYCVAGESGFERTWVQEFQARDYVDEGLTERFNPAPRRLTANALYYGGEVAFGLVPYRWEYDLAQSDFVWVRPPRYPVPSGFGYWSLATLCYTAGGRYFVYDFSLPASHPSRAEPSGSEQERGKGKKPKGRKRWMKGAKGKSEFDYSRLALLAPDLRPRGKILKDLNRDWRVQTIVRVWEHLANDALPVIQRLGSLERRGGRLVPRPERPVRSTNPPLGWFEDMNDVKQAAAFVKKRLAAVQTALKWWESANGKERSAKPGADALQERVEADFQLLGVQLRKVRFHHNEALAALATIKALDVTYRTARIVPRPIAVGVDLPARRINLGSDERDARFAEVILATARMARKYPGTPWSLLLKKGRLMTFEKVVRIIPEEGGRERKPRDKKGGKGESKPPPAKLPRSRPAPKPGPRPGSSGAGPTTGK